MQHLYTLINGGYDARVIHICSRRWVGVTATTMGRTNGGKQEKCTFKEEDVEE
ncbi:hypothetical protein ACQRD6_12480 [Prevotella sp. SGI.027]|nr:hypothetical protein [Prevotella sp.]